MTGAAGTPGPGEAAALLRDLEARGWSLATAESLTGGLLSATVVDVPGASRVLRGAVVAYATDVKESVLGVDAGLLAAHGAVHPEVARQMAERVRAVLGADVGVATTGVAGPDPQDGQPPGTVYVAVSGPRGAEVRHLHVPGDRAAVRAGTVAAALALARAVVGAEPAVGAGTGENGG
ncbi:CinA family protein [Cellulosimicrobium composti]|uniref:CinA family protein n=1 Tax=Cellulosimicrobium composti TaxID=2672572 RepID=A0ABX0BDQ2_9MICO|nr:nicotinamide-nucleotide amidohydrolase family protein [Cellulosimicrobium composti]NDO90764.1 CinA family protein [Cellulosimicrobium composti]